MAQEQDEDTPKKFAKGKMIGDNDPTMVSVGASIFPGKLHKVLHIEGENGPSLSGSESQLFGVWDSPFIGLVGGETIDPSIPKDPGKQRIHIFIQIQSDGHVAERSKNCAQSSFQRERC